MEFQPGGDHSNIFAGQECFVVVVVVDVVVHVVVVVVVVDVFIVVVVVKPSLIETGLKPEREKRVEKYREKGERER